MKIWSVGKDENDDNIHKYLSDTSAMVECESLSSFQEIRRVKASKNNKKQLTLAR